MFGSHFGLCNRTETVNQSQWHDCLSSRERLTRFLERLCLSQAPAFRTKFILSLTAWFLGRILFRDLGFMFESHIISNAAFSFSECRRPEGDITENLFTFEKGVGGLRFLVCPETSDTFEGVDSDMIVPELTEELAWADEVEKEVSEDETSERRMFLLESEADILS